MPKRHKRVSRAYGGNLCAAAVRERYIIDSFVRLFIHSASHIFIQSISILMASCSHRLSLHSSTCFLSPSGSSAPSWSRSKRSWLKCWRLNRLPRKQPQPQLPGARRRRRPPRNKSKSLVTAINIWSKLYGWEGFSITFCKIQFHCVFPVTANLLFKRELPFKVFYSYERNLQLTA